MKLLNKFIAFICVILLGTCSCLAKEELEIQLGNDYLITTDKAVISVFSADPSIINLSPFFTIFNEKNVYLLHPQKIGQTEITVFCKDGDYIFDLTIKPEKPAIKIKTLQTEGFEIMLLDTPPDFGKFKVNPAPQLNTPGGEK